jgi:hypothetical protein
MTWSANIVGAEQLSAEMRAKLHAALVVGAEKIGIEGQRLVVQNITTPYNGVPPAVFTGNLAHSVQFQVVDQAMIRLVIGVGPTLGADRYAAPVETGARPHMPPASALVPWVIRKLGADDETTAVSIAFAIAKTIARRGTQGHEMFDRAQPELEPMVAPILEHEIAQALMGAGGAA